MLKIIIELDHRHGDDGGVSIDIRATSTGKGACQHELAVFHALKTFMRPICNSTLTTYNGAYSECLEQRLEQLEELQAAINGI